MGIIMLGDRQFSIGGVELHLRDCATGLDEVIFFNDVCCVECEQHYDTIDVQTAFGTQYIPSKEGKPIKSNVRYNISFECGRMSRANVHAMYPVTGEIFNGDEPKSDFGMPEISW